MGTALFARGVHGPAMLVTDRVSKVSVCSHKCTRSLSHCNHHVLTSRDWSTINKEMKCQRQQMTPLKQKWKWKDVKERKGKRAGSHCDQTNKNHLIPNTHNSSSNLQIIYFITPNREQKQRKKEKELTSHPHPLPCTPAICILKAFLNASNDPNISLITWRVWVQWRRRCWGLRRGQVGPGLCVLWGD
jgi:hypothetical protein